MPVDKCICGQVHDYSNGFPPNDYDNPNQLIPPHTPARADTESDQQRTAKRRTINRRQERNLKYYGGAVCG